MNFLRLGHLSLLALGLGMATSAHATFSIYNYSAYEFVNYWVTESYTCTAPTYLNSGLLNLNGGSMVLNSPDWTAGTRLCVTINTPTTHSVVTSLNPYNCTITVRDNWFSGVNVTVSSSCSY